MFYSNVFVYDGKYSDDYEIHLVYENDSILNEYGINFDDKKEITLTFAYANKDFEQIVWEEGILRFVHDWFITEDFKPFVSFDEAEYSYMLRGKTLVKRFNHKMQGLIDVTFEILENFTYKFQNKKIVKDNFSKYNTVYNYSNFEDEYKPLLELKNIQSSEIRIENKTSNKILILSNLPLGKDIFVDNEMGVIVDSDENNLIKYSNRDWITLKKGSNNIVITGSCDYIKIKSMYPIRK